MNWHRIGYLLLTVAVISTIVVFSTGYRVARTISSAKDVQDNIRYLIESGGTIGEAPAGSALSSSYLELIFTDEPELLEQVKTAVEKGSEEMPEVREGEISAILVTYYKNGDNQIENAVAHVIGGFPLGQRKVSMHRDGFFASQLDRNLWSTGDSSLRFLGRDLAVWANSEEERGSQRELIEAIFAGEIIVLAERIQARPLHYTAVFPAPKQIVPMKMRDHVRAIMLRGYISPDRGSSELIILTDNERSTALMASTAHDLKMALQIALRTRFAGVLIDSPWGPYIPVWWAYEMANTLEDIQLTRRERTIRMSVEYERRMVNATLKTIERFGRDYSQIKGTQEEKLDPRAVDARMQTRKPMHYWSEDHRWGPDWPFGSGTNVIVRRPTDTEPALDSAPAVTQPL